MTTIYLTENEENRKLLPIIFFLVRRLLLLLGIILACSATKMLAQENNYHPASDCPNFNAFSKTNQVEMVKPLVSDVRKNGTIFLYPEKASKVDTVLQLMGLSEGTTFQLKHTTKSRLDSTRFFLKYQQYYYGVEVEGGGYTTSLRGTGIPDDPCAEIYMLAPHILTEIKLEHKPAVSIRNLPAILRIENADDSKLVITHNLTNNCEYRLIWKVQYYQDYSKTSWIDAHTGEVIQTKDSRMYHNAPTLTYGPQWLDDRTEGNSTSLQTPDGRVRVFDLNFCTPTINSLVWDNENIPVTNHPDTWTNEADPHVIQTFHAVTNAVNEYDEIGINFGTVRAGACSGANAHSLQGSTTNSAFITFGRSGNLIFSTFDIAGHELAHTYLNEFLEYTDLGNKSLHEGISDILGTYIESQIQDGVPDWIIGDDDEATEAFVFRDLENPNFGCFSSAPGFEHARGLTIGHWYYLISEGSMADNIPALGMLPALNILLESLPLLSTNSDIPDLMGATLTLVEEQFGRCSNEFVAVANAWEEICVPTGFANLQGFVEPCYLKICGNNWVCEESDYLELCACGTWPISNPFIRFTILDPKGVEFKSASGMEGNQQNGYDDCLTLIDFPKYEYYPHTITIRAYIPSIGWSVEKKVTLVDCNGDDKPCGEAPSQLQNNGNENRSSNGSEKTQSKYVKVCAFDLLGKQIFMKETDNLQRNEIFYQGILILVFYGENGEIVKVDKAFLAN